MDCRRVVRAIAGFAGLAALGWAQGATVSWNTNSSGFWSTGSNWSSGAIPGSADDVLIDRPGANPLITFSSGAGTVQSLTSNESLRLSAGELTLSGASQINASFTLASPSNASSYLTVLNSLTIGGNFNWQGPFAALGGPGTTTLLGASTINGGWVQSGHRIINRGSAVLSGSMSLESGGVFENAIGAVLDLKDDWTHGLGGLIDKTPEFVNSGTFKKSSGTGESFVSVLNSSGLVQVSSGTLHILSGTSSGRFEVAPGAVLALGGSNRLTSTSSVEAAGNHVRINAPTLGGSGGEVAGAFAAGTLTVYNGTYDTPNISFVGAAPNIGTIVLKQGGHLNISTADAVTLSSLDLGTYPTTPGVLSGSATVNVTGLIVSDGGWMRGTGTTNALGGIVASFGVLDGRTLNNSGNAIGHIGAGNGSTINNLSGATWTMINGFDSDPTSRFNNAGLVLWNVPTAPGDAPISSFGGTLINSGMVEARAGRVTWSPGKSVNTGTIKIFDGVKLEIYTGELKQEASGKLLAANSDLDVGLNGATLLLDGEVAAKSILFRHGAITLSGSGQKTIQAITTDFHATGKLTVSGSGANITQWKHFGGTAEITGEANVIRNLEVYGGGVFKIATGTVYAPAESLTLNGGILWVEEGSGFAAPGGANLVVSGSTVIVDGTLNAPFVDVGMFSGLGGRGTVHSSVGLKGRIDSGAIPGTDFALPGKLTIAGDLETDGTARLIAHIGAAAGGIYDSLDVSGLAQLAGALQVGLADGYVPTAGDSFVVLTFGSRSGTFSSYIGLQLSPVMEVVPVWGEHELTLNVVAVPEPREFVLMLAGLALILLRASQGRARSSS